MSAKRDVLVILKNQEYDLLKNYCASKGESMTGAISRVAMRKINDLTMEYAETGQITISVKYPISCEIGHILHIYMLEDDITKVKVISEFMGWSYGKTLRTMILPFIYSLV